MLLPFFPATGIYRKRKWATGVSDSPLIYFMIFVLYLQSRDATPGFRRYAPPPNHICNSCVHLLCFLRTNMGIISTCSTIFLIFFHIRIPKIPETFVFLRFKNTFYGIRGCPFLIGLSKTARPNGVRISLRPISKLFQSAFLCIATICSNRFWDGVPVTISFAGKFLSNSAADDSSILYMASSK